jgi:hypothetical protein
MFLLEKWVGGYIFGECMLYEGYLKIDGHDDAIVGTACIWRDKTRVDVLVYNGNQILDTLSERDGMSYEEAAEYCDFNIEGAYMGEKTPVIYWDYDS